MNSAAVIGRQLRQQQTTGRTSGPLVPPSPHRGRPRTPSHQPAHQPHQSVVHQGSGQQGKSANTEKKEEKGLEKMTSCISCRCIWLCFKALSGGILMIAIGLGMTVFGFYADTFAVQEVNEGNKTIEVINEDLKYHMHNLTFVGPVVMGLGGMLIVAACVMTFEANEANARVVPMTGRRPSDAEGMLTEQLLDGPIAKAEKRNGPMSPFMITLDKREVPEPGPPRQIPDKGGGVHTSTIAEVNTPAVIPNGPNREKRPEMALPVRTSPPSRLPTRTTNKKRRSFLSPLYDEFVPSPQDIQIPDPDGCTPDSSCTLEMDVYVTKCPRTVKVKLEPRYLASIESDGLSDTDTADSELLPSSRGRFCSPCEVEEQDIPLLGRCSPPSSPEYPMEPVLKRDSNRRFRLMRQAAVQDAAAVARLYDGPSSQGGSR